MRVFDFFKLLKGNMFNGTLKIRVSFGISWRCLNILIGLVVYLIVTFFSNFEISELQI